MNRIDAHSTGIEWSRIADCVARPRVIKWSDCLSDQFEYIDLTSVDRVTHKIAATETITSETAPSRAQQIVRAGDVIFGTTRPTLSRYAVISADHDGQICSTGFCVLRPNPELVLTNYLFHLLGTQAFQDYVERNQRGASYPAITDGLVKEHRIPVPPLEVQREIVDILDRFTELEAELDAELCARQHQYKYYRDWLFAFDGQGIQSMPMGAIGTFTRGRRFTKNDVAAEGVASIHYGEIYTRYGTSATEVVSRVRPELAPSLRFAQPGDVVIAAVGETVEEVCKAVAWLGKEAVAVHDDCFILHHAMNPKFVAYYFQTSAFHSEKVKYVTRAKVKRVSGASLARLTIPVPPIDEQERVVGILDKFDALVNDLTVGLPAELKARRQQYEYYRDRLLAFPEAA
jgi:type I restriction enzyme S subunit